MVTATSTISYTDLNALNHIENDSEGLDAVARQFESLFVNQMLKAMREATAALAEGSLLNSSELTMRQEMLDNQLAIHLSESGGLGLRTLIMAQLGGASSDQAVMPSAMSPQSGIPVALRRTEALVSEPMSLKQGFIQGLLPQLEAKLDGSPLEPRAVLAQAALETGWGRYIPRRSDGHSSFNLFGIKASAGNETTAFANGAVNQRTTEYVDGEAHEIEAEFRAYPDFGAAIADYRALLQNSPRYAGVLRAAKDPVAFADALQEAGYATDPKYAMKLRQVHEDVERWLDQRSVDRAY